MDVDMDIDYDLDPEVARLQADAAALNALPSAMEADNTTATADADAMVEDGEVHPSDAVANKIHLSGVETLTTNDIKRFAHDNNQSEDRNAQDEKIEWVNDHSANIVYRTDAAAAAALKAFSVTPTEDPLETRPAHSLLTNPEVQLFVRQALVTDVKVQGAAAQSTFYLRNPEYDPDLHPRSRGRGRGGNRGRGGSRSEYRRHGGGRDDEYADRERRRSSGAEKGFNVDLYDDIKSDAAPKARRSSRRSSADSGRDLFAGRRRGRDSLRRSVDLGGSRRDGRLRDRSASPTREGDGRYGFSDDQPYRATARHRTPPPRERVRPDNRSASKAIKADLFANRKPASALQNGNGGGAAKAPVELFPNRAANDLFPDKLKEKREKEKKELRAADITSGLGKCTLNEANDTTITYQNDDSARQRPRYTSDRNGGDLIKNSSSQHGRLTDEYGEGTTFSIKGAGSGGANSDFTILGASSKGETRGGGRDLFDNRSGRSGQRLSR